MGRRSRYLLRLNWRQEVSQGGAIGERILRDFRNNMLDRIGAGAVLTELERLILFLLGWKVKICFLP